MWTLRSPAHASQPPPPTTHTAGRRTRVHDVSINQSTNRAVGKYPGRQAGRQARQARQAGRPGNLSVGHLVTHTNQPIPMQSTSHNNTISKEAQAMDVWLSFPLKDKRVCVCACVRVIRQQIHSQAASWITGRLIRTGRLGDQGRLGKLGRHQTEPKKNRKENTQAKGAKARGSRL